MKLGFLIDNRRCIGCHACTVACKSEHDVPVGVNRTWVKYVEKGQYPDTRRLFSVLRCNHCENAPCVEICPTSSLHYLDNGIVDFDNDRCIGCKACMQACPYDALHIHPDTHTSAKCNFCAHRIEQGREPACVVVCPEQAIVFGDIEDSNTKISKLKSREVVNVRKPEKGTNPKLFYIDGDQNSLGASQTTNEEQYIFSEQHKGVGHYARYAEDRTAKKDSSDLLTQLAPENKGGAPNKSLSANDARRVYDSPSKGVLWGWEVSSYVWTKSISAGIVFMYVIAVMLGWVPEEDVALERGVYWISLIFLGLTGLLLIKDLDQPARFHYVLLRPNWSSWLVKGAYFLTVFGGIVSLLLLASYIAPEWNMRWLQAIALILSIPVGFYTGFLFAQAKGRDFWQSSISPVHMLLHAFIAGTMAIAFLVDDFNAPLLYTSLVFLGTNLLFLVMELITPHQTEDAHRTTDMILKGRFAFQFWTTVVGMRGLPFLMLFFPTLIPVEVSAFLVLAGLLSTEHLWVKAPQLIDLN